MVETKQPNSRQDIIEWQILGWAYFKKGAQGQHGRFHCLKQNGLGFKSICGHYQVLENEVKFMVFVPKGELRQRKICKVCEYFIELKEIQIP